MASEVMMVIAAHRSLATPLRGILRDWADLGVMDPVLLVDLDQRGPDPSDFVAMEILDRITPVRLQDWLADHHVDCIRLGVVSDAASESARITPEEAVSLRASLVSALPSAKVVATTVTVGSPGDNFAAAIPDLLGWHAMVVSPEDAASPASGVTALALDWREPRWFMQVAGTICSLLGAWRGQSSSPLDDRNPVSNGGAMLVRSFSRAVAGETVEGELQSRLVNVGARYPVPHASGSSSQATDDPESAVKSMADGLVNLHPEIRPSERAIPTQQSAVTIGFLEALKAFFAFMWTSLKNAPEAFARGMLEKSSAALAGGVQRMVFGADSNFQVAVRGVSADGVPASWSATEEGIEVALQQADPQTELGAPPQMPQLWRDYVDGALTLLDAGSRKLPPVTIGVAKAVVTDTAQVAPDPANAFTLPDDLASYLPSWRIEVADVIGARRLNDSLARLANTTPQLAQEIGTERYRLRQWSGIGESSYVGRLGGALSDTFSRLTDEIVQLEAKIESLQQTPQVDQTVVADQRKLSLRFRILGGTSLAVILVLIGLVLGGILGVLIGVGLVIVSIVGTMLTGALLYMRGQQSLYQFMHRREQGAKDLETALQHRKEALTDLRRVSRGYRQYLDWSRALCAFVHAPLGRPQGTASTDLQLGQGLPRSIRLGEAVLDRAVIESVVAELRQDTFRTGWLSGAWASYLREVPPVLGALRIDQAVLDQDGNPDGEGSVLTRWSHAVAERADMRPVSSDFLDETSRALSSRPESRAQLTARIAFRDPITGELRELSGSEFERGLDSEHVLTGTFAAGAIVDAPHTLDARAVAPTSVLHDEFNGLAQAKVLVQFGPALERSDFATGRAAPVVEPHALNASGPVGRAAETDPFGSVFTDSDGFGES